jgi:hypothetical protein
MSWKVTNATVGFAKEGLISNNVDTFILPMMTA